MDFIKAIKTFVNVMARRANSRYKVKETMGGVERKCTHVAV
jgi:hypothetical protein